MNFLLDENVSLGLGHELRHQGHAVVAIAEIAQRGLRDDEVWLLAREPRSILITRDYHFTNPARFQPAEIGAIIYLRPGNLTAQDEIALVLNFLEQYSPDYFTGKLVVLSRRETKIR